MASNFMTAADELEALLRESGKSSSAPHIDESYLVAANPVQSPEAQAAHENEELIPELVRTIVDYAIRSAPPRASAKNIGEAIGEGVAEAVHQLRLDDVKVVNALDGFLRELDGAVRSRLRMG